MTPPEIPTIELTLDITVSPKRDGCAALSAIPAFGDESVDSSWILNLDAFVAALSTSITQTVGLLIDDSGMQGAGEVRFSCEHSDEGWRVTERPARSSSWWRRMLRRERPRVWCFTWSSVAAAAGDILAAHNMLRATYPDCEICSGSIDGDPISDAIFDQLASLVLPKGPI